MESSTSGRALSHFHSHMSGYAGEGLCLSFWSVTVHCFEELTQRWLCTSFKSAPSELCHSLAFVAKHLCTEVIDPECIAPLLAYHLITLEKTPGVRQLDIQYTCTCTQTQHCQIHLKHCQARCTRSSMLCTATVCAGQISGIEAAVHAVHSPFQNKKIATN